MESKSDMNTVAKRELTMADVLPLAEYEAVRAAKRAEVRKTRDLRHIAVGPFAVFSFESFATMWLQVHEMLRIEKGGDEQAESEIEAYAPLVPSGRELTATMMLEIENPGRRDRELRKLGGIEDAVRLRIGDAVVAAVPEQDQQRTDASGRASSVHFFHFPLALEQVRAFRDPAVPVSLEIDHANYAHAARLSPATRAELGRDIDA